ncbi:beta-lactamase family protein [Qipengyuania sp. YG27]|uniref:Beta-lactamase family protein n=1 Tax=Qipengyuania mesophila TaxID=2867246 RepID=A0ABS7JR75_9SPHN|nr:serine hydrolase [Qipengyuania mesophila]MBX7500109.1 beta-lactamase family protein [Qipengyuania mesophila]
MIRHAFAAAALLAAAPLAAQSTTQEQLDTRYDRALAAGYKALFLCSAIANAERNGATRTPESVEQWELTGIQAPLDEIVHNLEYRLLPIPDGEGLGAVEVDWEIDMPPRVAVAENGRGCSIQPIGFEPSRLDTDSGTVEVSGSYRSYPPTSDKFVERSVQTARPGSSSETASLMIARNLADPLNNAFTEHFGEGTRTTSVLVKRGDALVEQYAEGFDPQTPQRTWSVAKSIAATLVGTAVQRGEADVTKSAGLGLFFNDRRKQITIDNLLRMASGRYSDTPGNRTDPLYFGGATVEETALHWPLLHRPGTVYRYANNDTLAAVKAIGASLKDHPPAELFARLGMHDTVAETDWRGDYILSSQVWSTARDLAKLGQLYLDDGVLSDGTRILPEGWVDYVSAPSGPQPDGPFGYGAGFWLLNKSDGVPADTFAAMGNRGQYIVIVPSLNVVIVRRGEDPTGSRFDIAAFTRDVLESLEK